ncbi:hypothetical protein Bbelb_009050 [Branchiostoma belcheri]|nr:hypothetical protein Bbelb_009050 [Branchiostoma belcheri]
MSADPALLQHIENISKLCRICGQAVLKKRDKQKMYQPNPCRKYARRIHEIWGVDVTKDRGHRHPPAFCHRCRSKLARPPHFSRPKVVTWWKANEDQATREAAITAETRRQRKTRTTEGNCSKA